MKKSILLLSCSFLLVTFFTSNALAQQKKKSPPASASQKVNGVNIAINYHQPSKRDRLIWGGLVKYDQVWRTGANNATTFEISADMKVEGQLLKAGKYGLFTIPGKEKWTIIFNSVPDQWGAYDYDSSKDVLRVEVDASYENPVIETFDISIDKKGKVTLKWDKLVTSFKVS